MDVQFLRDSVSGPLAEACGAAAHAAAADPVEFVAKYLKHYISAEALKANLAARAAEDAADKEKARAEADAAVAVVTDLFERRKAAVAKVAELLEDPDALWAHVAASGAELTGAGSAYLALLQEDEEPEPEDEKEGEPAAEPPAEEAAPAEGEGEGEEAAPVFTYEDKHYVYVSASAAAAWLVGKELRRETPCASYALCDEGAELVDLPNVLYSEGVHFFRGFPRVGAYFAVPVTLATGEVVGMLGADTLKTPEGGSGKPLSTEEKQFIADLAKAFAAAMDAIAAARTEAAARAEEEAAAMEQQVAEAGVASEAAAVLASEAEAPAEGEAATTPAEEVPAEEAALKTEVAKLAAVVRILVDLKVSALADIKSYPKAPKLTYKVLKAVLLILGRKPPKDWAECRRCIEPALITDMKEFDAQGKRKASTWKRVRITIKGLDETAVMKESKAAAVMLKWISAVKAVSDAAVEARKAAKVAAGEEPEAEDEEGEEGAAPAEEPAGA